MAYCNKADMVTRFGEREIIQLTDRSNPKTNVINDDLLQAKIDDAAAEMDALLSCCYDVCEILKLLNDGYAFPVLKHWNCDITRKHLYDCIRLNTNAGHRDHKAQAEYEDYEKEIKQLCECGQLLAYKDGTCIEVSKRVVKFVAVTDQKSCIPYGLCCEGNCECS